jgi:low affinity Fe/Cu permease
MAKLLIVILTIFFFTSVAYGIGHKLEKKMDEDQAKVKTDRNSPVIIDNYIKIEIEEAERRCEYFLQPSLVFGSPWSEQEE